MKKLLIFFMLCGVVSGTHKTVGIAGDDANLYHAIDNSNVGDTIIIIDDTVRQTSPIQFKKRMNVRSGNGGIAHILLKTSGNVDMYGADSTSFDNISFGYDSGPVLDYNYMMLVQNKINLTFNNCKFTSYGRFNSFLRGIMIDDDNTIIDDKKAFNNCQFDSLYDGIGSITGSSANVKMFGCLVNGSNISVGRNWKMQFCIISTDYENQARATATKDTFQFCWFNGKGSTGSDLLTYKGSDRVDSTVFYRCTWVNTPHVALTWDQLRNSSVSKCLFTRNTGSSVYNHNNNPYGDTTCYNVKFDRNTYATNGHSFIVSSGAVGNSSYNVSVTNSIAIGGGTFTTDGVKNDTLKNNNFSYTPSAFTGFDAISGNTYNLGTSALRDTTYWPYPKAGSVYANTGCNDTLITIIPAKAVTINSFQTSIKVDSSLRFWDSTKTMTQYIEGDTLRTYLLVSTDSITGYLIKDSSDVNASMTSVLSASGLNSGTKYFYKIVSDYPKTGTIKFVDTTNVFSISTRASISAQPTPQTVTLSGSALSSTITSVIPSVGKKGTVFTITGSGFGTKGTLSLGTIDLGLPYSWTNTIIVDTIPSNVTKGIYSLIVKSAPVSGTASFRVLDPHITIRRPR